MAPQAAMKMARRASGAFGRLASKSKSLRRPKAAVPVPASGLLQKKPPAVPSPHAACGASRASGTFGIADQTAVMTVSLSGGHREFYGGGSGGGRSSSSPPLGRAAAALALGLAGAASFAKGSGPRPQPPAAARYRFVPAQSSRSVSAGRAAPEQPSGAPGGQGSQL